MRCESCVARLDDGNDNDSSTTSALHSKPCKHNETGRRSRRPLTDCVNAEGVQSFEEKTTHLLSGSASRVLSSNVSLDINFYGLKLMARFIL